MVEKKSFLDRIENPIRKDALKLAWPVLTELLLGSLFGMIDMMMLGWIADRALSAASIAAVGITNQPLFLGLSLAQALNVGGTAMISRYAGSKKENKIENVLRHVILLNLIILAIPVTIIGILYTDQIMLFMGAQPDALAAGRIYFKVIMMGFLFQSFNMSITAALRGVGETKASMKINIIANFFNVIGNAVLIYGLFIFPELGVTGAGVSTAISHVFATVMLLSYLLSKNSVIKVNLKNKFKVNKRIIKNLIRIGLPASLESLFLRSALIIFVRIVAGLGTVAYASHQIALNILSLSFKPGQAFGIAASSLVGMSLGGKKLKQAEEYAKETRKLGSIFSSVIAVILFLFGRSIASLYTSDPIIIQNTAMILKIIAFVQPFQSSQLILAGALRGAGDTLWPLISTVIGVLGVRVVIAHILVNQFQLGLAGAWIAVFIDQFVRWIFIKLRFRTGKWKYIRIH